VATQLRIRDRVDRALGRAAEHAIRAHHRRRLRSGGWERAMDPPQDRLWCGGEPPPRQGNAIDVLIDGENALPAMARAVREARSHVHIAGWHVSPDFELERGERRVVLRDLLAELADRIPVRVLVWAGSPAPVFSPTRRQVRKVMEELVAGTEIHCALDRREHPMHCHHEKLVIVDDEVAFVGGIDLTELAGDRFDHRSHPPRHDVGWHDASAELRGPIVGDVAEHFAFRWREVTGKALPAPQHPAPAGRHPAQLIRTVPGKIYDSLPRGDYRILEAYRRAFRSAKRLIYVENQFLWSPEIIEVLCEKLRDPPSEDFRLVVLVPVHPNNGSDVTRGQAAELAEADGDSGRFLACSLYARDEAGRPAPVYVHAKVAIVDDTWMTLGSANLNERSLFNDSEVNVVSIDPALARDTRERLWAEHLERPLAQIAGRRPRDLVDEAWRPIADHQHERRRRGAPLTHRLIRLPNVSRRSRRLLGPLESFVVDG
jgi:phosphatidylserine/phosphatidylglycerophosphate/cardiolipin synthase-like enzyme